MRPGPGHHRSLRRGRQAIARRIGSIRRDLGRRTRTLRARARLALPGSAPGRGEEALPGWAPDVHGNVRHFGAPGPAFEARQDVPPPERSSLRARTIAFYLPQFHAFDENDAWWGEGFTEWRNVARGLPRFAGHYQPRIPRDLGHYDLERVETLRAQAALARAAGIDAFCFYYYWFDGKRLMDGPLDRFAAADIEQDFCILWANENWTRRWDGREQDVLVRQSYREADEDDFIADTARYLGHPRYVRVAGRPLFIVYRADEIPDARATFARWRAKWAERLGVTPWLLMAQTYDDRDPRPYGLDGAVEFPPHKVSRGITDRGAERCILDAAFTGQVRDYGDLVTRSLDEPAPAWPLVKTVSPHWDNDARREGRGVTFDGSTPALYERWLEGAVARANAVPFAGDPLVFVNAWNEWAEGAYLEPDVHFGHAMLNATRRVLDPMAPPARAGRILLVGHDAHANGAQMILLGLAREFVERFGLDVTVLLMAGGALLPRYRRTCRTFVRAGGAGAVRDVELRDFLMREAFPVAICNSCVSGSLVAPLRASGARVLSLVHEMPALLRERSLRRELAAIAAGADHVVFPAELVRTGFESLVPRIDARPHILPQGLYQDVAAAPGRREAVRRSLSVDPNTPLVLNVGYADRRKGFDLFVRTALELLDAGFDAHFAWVGGRSPEMARWLETEGRRAAGHPRLHLEPFDEHVGDWFAAADCLLLSSREDPYPTVALEAMSVGLPVVSFANRTGLDALQARFGTLADAAEPAAAARAVRRALADDGPERRAARIEHVRAHCRMQDYAASLLGLADPARRSAERPSRGLKPASAPAASRSSTDPTP